jgi:hypothetical protein
MDAFTFSLSSGFQYHILGLKKRRMPYQCTALVAAMDMAMMVKTIKERIGRWFL